MTQFARSALKQTYKTLLREQLLCMYLWHDTKVTWSERATKQRINWPQSIYSKRTYPTLLWYILNGARGHFANTK